MIEYFKYYLYETLSGDTFDSIALDFYDNEYLASEIIKLNPEHTKALIFKAGVVLKIPVITEEVSTMLPPWKR